MLRIPLRRMALLVGISLGAPHARADLMYVSNASANLGAVAITRIDTTTGVQTPFVTTLPGGNGGLEPLTLDAAGNLYVGVTPASGPQSIEKYTPGGVGTLYATLLPGTNTPSGLAFDAAGNLYVANINAGGIEKIAPGGGAGSVTTVTTVPFSPFGLAISPLNGNLDTINSSTGSAGPILQITPGGTMSTFLLSGAFPSELSFDTAGNLYASDPAVTGRVNKISSTAAVSPYASTGLAGGLGMAFDSVGNLYVDLIGSQSIERIAPNGTVSPFATLGAPGTTGLQFLAILPSSSGAVPEPSSLTLLGLGLSGLATWIWRRGR